MAKHKHAELIKAWADGAAIQVCDAGSGRWIPVLNPKWNPDREYRVKPDLPRYRVGLMRRKDDPTSLYTISVDVEREEASYAGTSSFVRWLTDWIEYDA